MTLIDPPQFLQRRQRGVGDQGVARVDPDRLLQAIQEPQPVSEYAPKSKVVDAGSFEAQMTILKDSIKAELENTAAALEKQAATLRQAATEQCAAIDLAVTDAHVRQQAAMTMAEAFARVSGDITGQVKAVLAARENPAPVLEAGTLEGARGGDDNG